MSNQENKLNTCGCCEGIQALTPALLQNQPGLSALAYRVGTHANFKMTMQSALSGHPALWPLTTRDDDDPAIALCDAWATVLDVLSFYEERIANEGYLRTATERRSILEMARSIGYELRPGVAASTYLAFTLETAPGAPSSAKIGVGTKAQSVPGQDELPQVFETIEEIEARGEWNELKPLSKRIEIPGFGAKEVYLKGILTGLKPGDGLLMIGAEREADAGSERWDFRRIKEVKTDPDGDFTKVVWNEGLGWQIFSRKILPAEKDFQVLALRKRAFLFGHNAPDWRTMPDEVRARYLNGTADASKSNTDDEWPNFNIASISETPADMEIRTIYLNSLYPEIVEDSWLILVTPEPNFYVEVYKVTSAVESSRKDFTLTAKTTAVTLDGENLRQKFDNSVRETVVFAHSEELEIAEKPLMEPVEGNQIVLDRRLPDLEEKRTIIISGKRMRAQIPESTKGLELTSVEGTQTVGLSPKDTLVVMKTPEIQPDGQQTWSLRTKNGFVGTVTTKAGKIKLTSAQEEDEIISEVNLIKTVARDNDLTVITLEKDLNNSFDRPTAVIKANVAKATHGETKGEILGSGDGSQPFQKFELKQKPLTYVSAATPSGTKNTLEVRVNDLLWEEVNTLDQQPAKKRGYISRIADDGTVKVQFGDGNNGARPPTGRENVSARYRIGTGLGGMVKARQINLLMTQTLGVKGVVNPLAPTGAADPEKLENARRNAPLTVLTFDRIVSLQDYEDFASGFAGIGKAQANILWDGEQRLVHITVAAADRGSVPENSELYQNLIVGIDAARHADHGVKVDSYVPLTFDVKASVQVDSSYLVEDVFTAIKTTVLKTFSFEKRSFGQAVTQSEVHATIQKVKGVVALNLDALHFTLETADVFPRLPGNMADWEVALNSPAKLLTVNPRGITLTEMTI